MLSLGFCLTGMNPAIVFASLCAQSDLDSWPWTEISETVSQNLYSFGRASQAYCHSYRKLINTPSMRKWASQNRLVVFYWKSILVGHKPSSL